MTQERIQHGGTHYLDLKIHPYQFAMVNRWDVCSFSTLKYLTRYRSKGKPIEDLNKAIQFIKFRAEFDQQLFEDQLERKLPRVSIPMQEYVGQNSIHEDDEGVFYDLEQSVWLPGSSATRHQLISNIEVLRERIILDVSHGRGRRYGL